MYIHTNINEIITLSAINSDTLYNVFNDNERICGRVLLVAEFGNH